MVKAKKKQTTTKKPVKEPKQNLSDHLSSAQAPQKDKKKLDPRFAKLQNLKVKTRAESPSKSTPSIEKVVHVDEASTTDTYNRIHALTQSLLEQILTTGKPSFEIPSRSSTNIVWDEVRDLLLLGDKVVKRPFHNLASVMDATRLMRLIEIVNEILIKDIHATKREIYYHDVDLFEDQKYSDKIIEDLSAMLKVIRNSTHVVASAKGACIGRLKIRDSGDEIDLERGSGGWSISPFLAVSAVG